MVSSIPHSTVANIQLDKLINVSAHRLINPIVAAMVRLDSAVACAVLQLKQLPKLSEELIRLLKKMPPLLKLQQKLLKLFQQLSKLSNNLRVSTKLQNILPHQ